MDRVRLRGLAIADHNRCRTSGGRPTYQLATAWSFTHA